MTIGSKPFTSKPCSANAQQTTKDNGQAEQRAKDFQKIKASREENESKILQNSSLQQVTEDVKKPLEFVLGLNDKEAKQLLAMANMDAMASKSGYEGFSQLKAATWSSEVIGFINDSKYVPFAINMKEYPNAISAINTLQESAKKIEYKEPEGIRLRKNNEWFDDYQERLNKLDLLLLNSEENIDNYATALKNKLLQLGVNECYCMAGGWRGESGHAMVYRFKKTENEKFNIYIYNAQSGSETMQGGECIQGQIKSKPCYCFEGVTCEELFFAEQKDAKINGNPIILKRLIELQLDNIITNKKKYSIKDVLNLLSRFGARLTPTKKLPKLYLSVQRSGNCSFKSINCLLLEIMNDEKKKDASIESIGDASIESIGDASIESIGDASIESIKKDYKRLMLNARFLSLLAFYNKYKENFNEPKYLQHNYMLGHAVEDYLKILQKNLNRGTISQNECSKVVATFYDLLCKLRVAAEKAHNTNTKEITSYQINLSDIDKQDINRNKKIAELSKPTQPKLQDKVSFSLNAKLGDITSWDKLSEELKKLKNILDKAEESSCYQSVISQFEITIGKLFSNLNNVENCESGGIARSNQEALCNCLDIYTKNVQKLSGYSSQRVQNAGMASMAISYLLAVKQDPVVGGYGLYIKYFQDMANVGTAIFSPQDADVLKQRQELLNFYKNINGQDKWQLFDFNKIEICYGDIIKDAVPEIRLYANIAQNKEENLTQSADKCPFSGLDDVNKLKAGLFFSMPDEYPDNIKHIGYLKQTALSAFVLFSPGGVVNLANKICIDQLSKKLQYCYSNRLWNSNSNFVIHYRTLSEGDYPIADSFNKYYQNSQHHHKQAVDCTFESESIRRENSILVYAEQQEVNEIDCALSEPQVQTSLLIKLIEDNLSKLTDSEWWTEIEALLFKTYQDQNDITISPIYEQIKLDNALIYKIDRLTDACYKECIERVPSNPKWEVMLFVIRLRSNLLFAKKRANPDYEPDTSSKACNEKMLAWLEEYEQTVSQQKIQKDIPDKCKLELEKKLHELQIARSGLLLGIPPKVLSIMQLVQLFNNMMEINSSIEAFSQLECRAFLRECQHRFVLCQNDWQDLLSTVEARNNFGDGIIKSYSETFSIQGDWQFTDGQLHTENWVIDLTRPMVMYDGKALGKTMCEITPAFKRLFGNRQLNAVKEGEDKIRFKDSNWGDIEIVGKGGDSQIYRYIKAGNSNAYEKFLYIQPDNGKNLKKELNVNDALYWDHAFWVRVPTNQDEKVVSELRIYDLHDGSKCLFRSKENSQLIKLADPAAKPFVFYLPPEDYSQALKRFDDLEQVETWAIDEDDKLHHIEFPRYIQDSSSQAPLRFDWDNTKKAWIYTKDQNYQLSQEGFEPFFSTNQRYLNLVKIGDPGKHKVLIPVGKLLAEGFEQYSKIDTGESNCDGNKLSRTYFEYEYDDKIGKMIPSSLEARVYLAHIYLAQKRYQEAKEILKDISISENPSNECISLVKKLLVSEINLHDKSPDACAIRLYAYSIFQKINSRIEDFGLLDHDKEEDKDRTIFDVYQDYLNGIEHVEQPLLLTKTEELQLLKELPDNLLYSASSTTVWDSDKAIIESFDVEKLAEVYDKPYLECNSDINAKDYAVFSDLYNKLMKGTPLEFEAMLYQLLTDENNHFSIHMTSVSSAKIFLIYIALHKEEFINTECPAIGEFKQWFKGKIDQINLKQPKKPPTAGIPKISVKIDLVEPESKKITLASYAQKESLTVDEESWTQQSSQVFNHNTDQIFKQWQTSYLIKPTKVEENQAKDIVVEIKATEKQLTVYHKVAQVEQERYTKDCEEAKNQEAAKYSLTEKFSADGLLSKIKTAFSILNDGETEIPEQKEEKQLLELVLAYADQLPTDTNKYYEQLLSKEAHHSPLVKLDEIMRAAATSLSALKTLNPNLSDDEVIKWRSACLDYMVQVTHRRQANLIYRPLKKWVDAEKDNKDVPQQWKDEVLEALSQERTYDPYDLEHKDYFPLMFEYFSGFRVRHNQAAIIKNVLNAIVNNKDEELGNKIFQLIMAGGKTSVIISIILEIVAQNGQLPVVLCHPSQYASVCGNLHNFQESRYGKDLYALKYTIQELGDEKVLDEIIRKIEEAEAGGNAIIMNSFMPQVIELKYILELLRLVDCNDKDEDIKKRMRLQEKLAQINNKFIKNGVGVLDECDIILSMLMEVNVPVGDEQMLTPERSELVSAIYLSLATNSNIKDLVKLDQNKQSELSKEDYFSTIAPTVAEDLFSNDSLCLKDYETDYKEAFIRYVTGKISVKCQQMANDTSCAITDDTDLETKKNILFLRYIAELKKSNDKYKRKAADNIAITARIIKDVLPLALSRSCNRAYGRDLAKDDGRVIPYLGVGTPATTRFGYVYLALCYQLQTALNSGITEGGLLFLANKINEAAGYFATKDQVTFDETVEAKWFFKCTKQKLNQVLENKALLKEACAYINYDQQRRLEVEAEIAQFHVKYYQDRVCSNPINFIEQMHNWVGCSGTPWNWHSYHRKLGDLMVDQGSEGRIVNEMLKRADDQNRYDGYKALHVIKDDKLATILDQIKTHPKAEQLRCLIDAGGFLKDNDNEKVATKILDACEWIDAIVYLHRFPKDEKGYIRESFMLLQRTPEGRQQQTILPNTSKEEIAKYVPDLSKLFVFYDELRATGTDIAMAPGTIGLVTVDPRMPVRTLLQSTLRERGYFNQNQDCEFLVTEKDQSEMLNQGKTLEDVISTLINNQAIAASDQTFRHYIAYITNVVRNYALKSMLKEKDPAVLEKLVSRYKNLFVASFADNPYEQFGQVEGSKGTFEILKQHAIKTIYDFFKSNIDKQEPNDLKKNIESILLSPEDNKSLLSQLPNERKNIVNLIQGILKAAKKDYDEGLLPKELIYRQGGEVDAQVQVDQEQTVEVALAQEQEVTLQEELQQELNLYNFSVFNNAFDEIEWKLKGSNCFKFEEHFEQIKSVKYVCDMEYNKEQLITTTKHFASCFPDNLYMSENLRMSLSCTDLPLFHKYMKQASFMLVTKDEQGNLKFLLLSKKDAADFKTWISAESPENAWLMDLNGLEEITNRDHPIPDSATFKNEIKHALWYANLFNGDASYLDTNDRLSAEIMRDNKKKVMSDYVLMRSYYNSRLRCAASASKVLKLSDDMFNKNSVLLTARRKKMERTYETVREYSEEKVANLTNEDEIILLDKDQFKYLKTKKQIEIIAGKLFKEGILSDYCGCFEEKQLEFFTQEQRNAIVSKKDLIGPGNPIIDSSNLTEDDLSTKSNIGESYKPGM